MKAKKAEKPKGLRLYDRDTDPVRRTHLEVREDINEGDDNWEMHISTPSRCVAVGGTFLDPDQLDKLAERCKAFATYLRTQPKPVNTDPRWEDIP